MILSWGGYDIMIYTPHGDEKVWQTIGHWGETPSNPGSEQALGLRYIWIDSLCIIQDDPDDWSVESAKMGRIYSDAYIVIASSQSRDGTESFLAPRHPLRTPLELSLALPDASPRKVLARPMLVTGLSNEPLDSRAWTYQEQRLATRLLRYTSEEMVFQCRTRWYRCECGSSHRALSIRELHQMALFGKYCEPIDSSQPTDYLFRQWQGMVSTYSMRSLTKGSDKLPAMSGIADLMQKATKSQFLAGLWVDNLIDDLRWSVEPNTILDDQDLETTGFLSRRASSEYRAPTFSWASINVGVISYGLTHPRILDPVAVVLDAKCDPKGANPLGEVTNGFLILEAYLVQAELSTATDRLARAMGDYELCREGMKTYMRADFPVVEIVGLLEDGSQISALGRATREDKINPIAGSVICLALGYSDKHIEALVLSHSGRVPGAYERLGSMVYDDIYWFDKGEVRKSVITIV
ncbi:hypothetical protein DL771_008935 [Monosporascus sp. 5C6A]|nr:hypothetical protein DL771_008935 [Monosporascus sp. 5C6A]